MTCRGTGEHRGSLERVCLKRGSRSGLRPRQTAYSQVSQLTSGKVCMMYPKPDQALLLRGPAVMQLTIPDLTVHRVSRARSVVWAMW